MRYLSLGSVALLGLNTISVVAQSPHHNVTAEVFAGISPNVKLDWHDCYEVFKCARLIVC